MRKSKMTMFAAANMAGVLLIMFSCRPQESINNVRFKTLDTTFYVLADTQAIGSIHINFVYPDSADATQLQAWQALFSAVISDDSALIGWTPEAVLQQQVADWSQVFRENASYDPPTAQVQYYTCLHDTIVYNNQGLLSLLVISEGDSGGAHGWMDIHGYAIDAQTVQFIKEADFAGDNYRDSVSVLILQQMMKDNGVTTPEALANQGYEIESIAPNDNFVLGEDGLTYYFNEYEIGPYCLGASEVTISYKDLAPYILEDSPISKLVNR